MCSPATLAMGSLGMSGAGAGMSTAGAFYGARGQQTDLRTQAYINDVNARLSEQSAQSALYAGQAQEQSVMARTARVKGDQKAAMAANGIDLGSQTAVNELTSTDVAGSVDAATVHANAVRSAWGYRTQATNYSNEALMERSRADAISPGLAAFTSLLGGASDVASKWYTYKKAGAF